MPVTFSSEGLGISETGRRVSFEADVKEVKEICGGYPTAPVTAPFLQVPCSTLSDLSLLFVTKKMIVKLLGNQEVLLRSWRTL